ncbi:hypothetical protein LguiA_036559 [Lonicera macranthoides]
MQQCFSGKGKSLVVKWANDLVDIAASLSQARNTLSLIATVCCGIWKAQNLWIFEGMSSSSFRVVNQVKGWIEEFVLLKDAFPILTPIVRVDSGLNLLRSSSVSAFCDASFDCANSEAAVGCVLFNLAGTLLDNIGKKVLASSALDER